MATESIGQNWPFGIGAESIGGWGGIGRPCVTWSQTTGQQVGGHGAAPVGGLQSSVVS